MQTGVLPTTYDFLLGGGEMGELIRAVDWSSTPVGPVEQWPQSLRTSISIMLNTHFPMYVAWGNDFTQFYNDGYRPILGSTKHPAAMGISSKKTFGEIWHIIGPMFEGVMEGNAVGFTDFMLPLDRHGFTEECYFIFSYSPIKQENGLTGGVLVTVTETSDRVLGERRLKTLRELGDRSAKSKNITDASGSILSALDSNRHDVPFSLFYAFQAEDGAFEFSGSTGLDLAATTLPPVTKIREFAGKMTSGIIPVAELFETISFSKDLPWSEPPQNCVGLVLSWPEQKNPFGYLLLGTSARLKYNDQYQSFFKLFGDQAVTALSNANAFEEARKRAEALAEIDRAKTAFFSNISHEFRTPLTLMLGPLEELLKAKDNLTAEQFENTDAAHRNAMRLLRLVNTLLDFSRIESGRVQAAFRPVDLVELITDLCSNFRSVIEKAGLRFDVFCDQISDAVYVDTGMWEKIVLNLLSNAFKYTLKGNITVQVRQEGRHVAFSVRDTGVGIPEKELPNMFERFHRIMNTAGRSYEGTGIGLSLVNELVKLHGGTIAVESKLHEGSVFTVRFPVGFGHLSSENVFHELASRSSSEVAEAFLQEAEFFSSHSGYQKADPVAGSIKNSAKDATILIVDDNADMVKYLTRMLEPKYEIITAYNGEVALSKISERVPDLVISDIMMPVMDGVEMLRRIKADPKTSDLPVMLLSARAGEESRIEGLDVGADDYLVKPFSAKELISRVRSQIQIARSRSHLSAMLQQVFDQTPAAITIIRKERHTVEFANDRYLEIVGKNRDFIGKPLFESLPELQHQGISELLDGVMETGTPYLGKEFELTLNRGGNQHRVYFNFIYHPLREEDQSISGVIVVCFEVTDLVIAKKKAEEGEMLLEAKVKERTTELEAKNEELTQQRDFVETILNSSIDIISVFDNDLRFMVVNRRFEDVYNLKRDAVIGRKLSDVFPGTENSSFYSFLKAAGNGTSTHTNGFQSPITGRLYQLYVMPLKYNDEVYAVLAVAHDNTDVIAFANELEVKNSQLTKVNEELEQFAYVASHDLQEPLRKIRTFSSMLERDMPPDVPSRRYFEKIHSSSARMSRLIKDLLNYSRLSNAKVTFEDIDLNVVMESVASDFELLIEEKDAVINYPKLPTVQGIQLQLHQLFSNLISNALKFSSGKPVIDISHRIVRPSECSRISTASNDSDYLELSFRDNGIGFDQKFSDRIFTIFQRLNETETTGTGIGLALCKKIVENHHGHIAVESERDVGSTFYVYLAVNDRHPVGDQRVPG